MKTLIQYINEYLIKKKVDKVYTGYKYTPKTKEELINNIKELLDQGETNLNCIDISNITDISWVFNEIKDDIGKDKLHNIDVSEWNVSNVKNISHLFSNCTNLNIKGLKNWDVSNVESMNHVFSFCLNFDGKDIEKWDVSKVEDMNFIFYGCRNLNCDLSKWNVSNVKDMKSMFSGCYLFDCDLSRWNVSNVEDMGNMFYNCPNFKGIGLERWDVSKVKTMDFMFSNCDKFNCDLSSWNVKNNISNYDMFRSCKSLKNTPKWYK